MMQRNEFLKSMLAMTAGVCLPAVATAQSTGNLKMMIPGGAGGGWDGTGRALGRSLIEAKAYATVDYENKGGAAGITGLTQYLNTAKGDPNSLIMMGAVMLGGIVTNKPAVSIAQCTPIAKLTSEYNVFVVAPDSRFKTMQDVVAAMKKDITAVKFGGGSSGSTEHIASSMLARTAGADPKKLSYSATAGGNEAVTGVLSGKFEVCGGGFGEYDELIANGKLRALGVTSERRLRGVNVPTLREQGFNVVIGNWRGVYGAPGINAQQQADLVQAVSAAVKTKTWQDVSRENRWTQSFLAGKEFADFVDFEFTSMRAIMYLSGMVKA
jgi:putative tricarboxylic transport membrane protein